MMTNDTSTETSSEGVCRGHAPEKERTRAKQLQHAMVRGGQPAGTGRPCVKAALILGQCTGTLAGHHRTHSNLDGTRLTVCICTPTTPSSDQPMRLTAAQHSLHFALAVPWNTLQAALLDKHMVNILILVHQVRAGHAFFYHYPSVPAPPPSPNRVGWAWTGGLHHRVSLQRIPLPGKVRSGWGSGTTAITSATHLELRWV